MTAKLDSFCPEPWDWFAINASYALLRGWWPSSILTVCALVLWKKGCWTHSVCMHRSGFICEYQCASQIQASQTTCFRHWGGVLLGFKPPLILSIMHDLHMQPLNPGIIGLGPTASSSSCCGRNMAALERLVQVNWLERHMLSGEQGGMFKHHPSDKSHWEQWHPSWKLWTWSYASSRATLGNLYWSVHCVRHPYI